MTNDCLIYSIGRFFFYLSHSFSLTQKIKNIKLNKFSNIMVRIDLKWSVLNIRAFSAGVWLIFGVEIEFGSLEQYALFEPDTM